jgi:titin
MDANGVITNAFDGGSQSQVKDRLVLVGSPKNFRITVPLTVPFGRSPGVVENCYASVSDSKGNSLYMNPPGLALTVNRTPAGLPSGPIGLDFDSSSVGTGLLSWLTPSFVGSPALYGYVAQYSLDGASWVNLPGGVTSSTSLSVSGLAPDTAYWFRVRGENGATVGEDTAYMNLNWAVVQIRTAPQVMPSAPKTLTTSNLSETGVTLAWALPESNGSSGITDYQIEVTSNSVNGWTVIPHSAFTSRGFNVFGLMPGRTYQFRVSAVTSIGVGAASNVVMVTTFGGLKPSAPASLTVSNVKGNSVVLAWPKVVATQKVSNYVLDVSLDGNTWVSVWKKVSTSSSISLSGLRSGRTYQVRIAAINVNGQGSYLSGSFTTLATVASAPRSLSFTEATSTGFKVNWLSPQSDGGAVITDYVVEVKGAGSDWVQAPRVTSNGTTSQVSGLKSGVRYAVRVKAINRVGVSASSSAFNITTLASAPSAPIAVLKSSSLRAAVITWTVTSDGGAKVSNYLVEYSTDNGNSWLNLPKTVSNSKTLTLRGLKTQAKYLFKVVAVNSVGMSPASEVVEVTLP